MTIELNVLTWVNKAGKGVKTIVATTSNNVVGWIVVAFVVGIALRLFVF